MRSIRPPEYVAELPALVALVAAADAEPDAAVAELPAFVAEVDGIARARRCGSGRSGGGGSTAGRGRRGRLRIAQRVVGQIERQRDVVGADHRLVGLE